MQFSVVAILSLAAFAVASPAQSGRTSAKLSVKRQATAGGSVPFTQGAMTDGAGNVVPYNAAGVYKDSVAKGL